MLARLMLMSMMMMMYDGMTVSLNHNSLHSVTLILVLPEVVFMFAAASISGGGGLMGSL